jgi:modulator of FtsH protease HflK
MEILAHLIEFLKSFWFNLLPFDVVNDYESGVILRFGRYHKDIEAGFIWKIPFVDSVMTCHNTVTTMVIKNQALTTKDEHPISVESIVKYKVINAKKYLLEVEDSIDAINDVTQGKIKELITHLNWDDLREFKDSEITDKVTKEARDWGIKIYYITITSLVKTRVFKLINTSH